MKHQRALEYYTIACFLFVTNCDFKLALQHQKLYLCHRITSSFFSCSHSECDYMSLAAILCIWRHCHKLYFAGFLSVLEKTTYTICEPCWKHLILMAPAILYNSLIDIFTIRTTIIRAS